MFIQLWQLWLTRGLVTKLIGILVGREVDPWGDCVMCHGRWLCSCVGKDGRGIGWALGVGGGGGRNVEKGRKNQNKSGNKFKNQELMNRGRVNGKESGRELQ